MLEQGDVREKSGEGSLRYREANRSLHLGMEAKDKSNHLTADSSAVSLRITGAQQLYQVKRMIRGIGNVLFSTYSQTKHG